MRLLVVVLSAFALATLIACSGSPDDNGDASDTPSASEAEGVVVTTAADALFPDDLEHVCRGGTVSTAPAYSAGPGLHPLLAFEGEAPNYAPLFLEFPAGWTTDFGNAGETELVACLNRTASELVETCTDYEDQEDDIQFAIELHDATYAVALYSAKSGEELAVTTLMVRSGDCPIFAVFETAKPTRVDYADPEDQLAEFVRPFVAP